MLMQILNANAYPKKLLKGKAIKTQTKIRTKIVKKIIKM